MPHIIHHPDHEAHTPESLSAEQLAEFRERLAGFRVSEEFGIATVRTPEPEVRDIAITLLAEVDRLKAENHAVWTEHGEKFRRDAQRIKELQARVAELEQAAQSRHCGRAMVHPEHRWMSDRRAVQCPGTKAGDR